jgi:hypothetical protein
LTFAFRTRHQYRSECQIHSINVALVQKSDDEPAGCDDADF